MDTFRIALIVAMRREVAPLVRKWRAARFITNEEAPVVYARVPRVSTTGSAESVNEVSIRFAGIGMLVAERAAEAAARAGTGLMVSAGFAGALKPESAIGNVVRPSKIVDAASGREYFPQTSDTDNATLVTTPAILSRAAKEKIGAQYQADFVDMEAAAIARVAEQYGIAWTVIKAVSEPLDLDIAFLQPFVDSAGELNLLKLTFSAALRPRLWGSLHALQRNSDVAARFLSDSLSDLCSRNIGELAGRASAVPRERKR